MTMRSRTRKKKNKIFCNYLCNSHSLLTPCCYLLPSTGVFVTIILFIYTCQILIPAHVPNPTHATLHDHQGVGGANCPDKSKLKSIVATRSTRLENA